MDFYAQPLGNALFEYKPPVDCEALVLYGYWSVTTDETVADRWPFVEVYRNRGSGSTTEVLGSWTSNKCAASTTNVYKITPGAEYASQALVENSLNFLGMPRSLYVRSPNKLVLTLLNGVVGDTQRIGLVMDVRGQ